MADFSTYVSLELPKSNEKYNVGVANKNNMVIDSELHKLDLKNQSQDNLLATKEALNEHINNKNNTHEVTKSQIGLNNVDNTSDMDKPVSTAQQNAIDTALEQSNYYTDNKIAELIDGAPETLDTLKEVHDAFVENTTIIEALDIAIGTKANQIALDTHTGNDIIHVTQTDKDNLNASKLHADSNHARIDATKVERSDTNGNIKINGIEVNVYTHPDGTNPHGITKQDIGLGNVENKSSEEIRDEITKENVINALGYTPPTTNTTYNAASEAPKANGIPNVGTSVKYAREDHIHPLQTDVSGNAGTATKWKYVINIDGMSVNGDASRKTYGVCSTAADVANKVVPCTGFNLVVGAKIDVKFTVTNTMENPTLNVNNTGAKPIYYRGFAIPARYLTANTTYSFRYNGTQWDFVGDLNTNYSNGDGIIYSDSEPTNLIDGMTWIGK